MTQPGVCSEALESVRVPLETGFDSRKAGDMSTCSTGGSCDDTVNVLSVGNNFNTIRNSADTADDTGDVASAQHGKQTSADTVAASHPRHSAHENARTRGARPSLSRADRACSTDSEPSGIADMMGWRDQRSRSLVNELLFDIYDRWHYGQRDSFDSDTITGYSSTSDAFVGRSDVIQLQLAERRHGTRLNQAFLQSKGTCTAASSGDV